MNNKERREQSLLEYYKNPNICKACGKIIEVAPNQKARVTRVKKYCNRRCAAVINNKRYIKRKKGISEECPKCGRGKSREAEICKKCRDEHNMFDSKLPMSTKGELFADKSTWYEARILIQKHAKRIMRWFEIEKKCKVCDYDFRVDVCHKKPVSEFPDGARIKEINNIDNLVYLCPNHHIEFDSGKEEVILCVIDESPVVIF